MVNNPIGYLEDDIVPLFSDGLSDIPTTVSTIILAGMGGKTIVDILLAHKEKLKYIDTIIVDAHTSVPFLRKQINDLGISDKVRILSNRNDIPELINCMNVFLFPSRYEGLGIVLIEAQVAGLPCVTSNNIPTE